MPQDHGQDSINLQSHVEAAGAHENLFKDFYETYDEKELVSGLRRRRRRATNTPDNPIKTVSLIDEGGVLFWRDDIPVAPPSAVDIGLRRRRLRRRAGLPPIPVLGGDGQMPD